MPRDPRFPKTTTKLENDISDERVPTKSVKVRDVALAMIEDDTPKVKQNYYRGMASCAIGGAGVQLGVNALDLVDKLNTVPRDGVPKAPTTSFSKLGHVIIGWNDKTDTDKADIGKMILERADEATLHTTLHVRVFKP